MKNRYFLLFVLLGISTPWLFSQSATDALRYSAFEVGGTARSIGAGGALSALGADFSVLSTNPAGAAWYRSSDFVITPTFSNAVNNSSLTNGSGNGSSRTNTTKFNLNSFGTVVASSPRDPDWRTLNFGIGFNRLANFHSDFYFEGTSAGSIVNRFLDQANSGSINDFESGPAIDSEALFDLDEDGVYESDFDQVPGATISREQDVRRSGGINELVFSLAGNYRERLMIGMTIGVPFISYQEEKAYREEDPDGNVPLFNSLDYDEELNTTGTGVNLKLGAIYRASQSTRFGLAVHTPTRFSLRESYTTSMGYSYTLDSGQTINGNGSSPDGLFDYKLRTPWRFIGSAGYVYKKAGFVSAELEYVNYQNNQFQFEGFAEQEREANQGIDENLTGALRLRLGGELAYEIFRFRAGLQLFQSPVEGDDALNNVISAGVGFREKSFYVDFAYQRRNTTDSYSPYLVSSSFEEQLVNNDGNNNQFVLGLGFRF
jgi:hypothetical protein